MNYIEINDQLKAMIGDLVDLGYKKTVIGKLLLGSSGYAPIIKYLDIEADNDLNLGIKPLSKVGNAVNYELHLVYVKNNNHEIINEIQEINNKFFDDLRNGIIKYMNSDEYITRKPYTVRNKRKNQFDAVLNEILFSDIISDDAAEENNLDNNLFEK